MTPLDDLDPPTFQFGRRRRERQAQREAEKPEPAEEAPREAGEGEGAAPADEDGLEIPRFEQPDDGPQITVSQPGEEEPKPPLWRRLPFAEGETGARVMVAIPWIIFAIVIVAAGGPLFMLALIGLGVICLREFFRMVADFRPLAVPAYIALTAMVAAAYFGGPFQILLFLAASVPLIYLFATRRSTLEGATVAMAMTLLGIAWFGIGFSHALLLRELPDHG